MTQEEALALEKTRAQIKQMAADVAKMRAETDKLSAENRYYPFIAGAAFFAAIAAFVKVFL